MADTQTLKNTIFTHLYAINAIKRGITLATISLIRSSVAVAEQGYSRLSNERTTLFCNYRSWHWPHVVMGHVIEQARNAN